MNKQKIRLIPIKSRNFLYNFVISLDLYLIARDFISRTIVAGKRPVMEMAYIPLQQRSCERVNQNQMLLQLLTIPF